MKHHPLVIPFFLTHEGCPHRCVFCNQNAMDQNRGARLNPDDIRPQVERFLNFRGKRDRVEIAFYGGNFLGIDMVRIVSLLEASSRLVDEGIVDGIRFSTRPDTVRDELLYLLRKYPISTVEIGVQSLNDNALRRSMRGHSAETTYHAVERLKAHGSRFGVQLMIGLPGDTEAESFKTAEIVSSFSPDFIRIYPTVVLKGSLLATWYAEGRYHPLPLDQCVSHIKQLYLFFRGRNIPVIRMGLQASETLSAGKDLLAGPFHPAFGHLVLSEIAFDQIVSQARRKNCKFGKLSIMVHPDNISRVKGIRSQNVKKLQTLLGLTIVDIISDPSCPGDRLVIDGIPVFLDPCHDKIPADGLK
ncbi:MAG: radical SAM protein [Thermodesulfobacteriota bacterium]